MNWKEINEKYPKAFLEWVKTMGGSSVSQVLYVEHGDGTVCKCKVERESLVPQRKMYDYIRLPAISSLPFYFDQYGIFVEAYIYDDRRPSKGWKAIVSYNEGDTVMPPVPLAGFSPDRLSATAAGITKAFEIREQQLNELNDNPIPLPK